MPRRTLRRDINPLSRISDIGLRVLLAYAGIPDCIAGKTFTVYAIDWEHANPYRLWQEDGEPETPTECALVRYREAGKLKPVQVAPATQSLPLHLTANATYLIVAE